MVWGLYQPKRIIMRPVTPENNPAYQIPPTMTTRVTAIRNGLAANDVQPVQGPATTYNTPEVLNLLDFLTAQNGGAPQWGNLNLVNQALVTSLINYFTKNETMKYGNARGSLIDNYGQYCSYCGTPVQDTALAIEHCLPKSEFPGRMLYYHNFFLSCPSCNSNKGSKPSFTMALNWARQFINPNPDFNQVMQGGFDRQLWPDSNYAWVSFPVRLYNLLTDPWQLIAPQNAWNIDNTQVRVERNILWANIQGFNNPIPVATIVATNNQGNPVLQLQIDNFINIIQLNAFQQDDYSDRRVTNRTVVSLNILASLRNLNVFAPGSPQWMLMLQQVFITARNAGFFEVWASLFYIISPPSQGQNSVYMHFRADATDPNQPLFYFRGTNPAQLPT